MNEIFAGAVAFSAIVLTLTFVVMGATAFLQPGNEIRVTINGTKTVIARWGETLLTALSDAGFHLPSTCGGKGTCGLCRVTTPGGAGDVLPAEKSKLTRRELRQNVRLACQVVLHNDLEIELASSMLDTVITIGRVASSEQLSPLIKEIVFDIPADCHLDPEPGAFVEVQIPPFDLSYSALNIAAAFRDLWQRFGLTEMSVSNPRKISRAYSVANKPQDQNKIVLNVRLAIPPPGHHVPPGIASSYLFSLSPGDDVQVRGPFGFFCVQDSDREMIFVGGGVGMAPLRSMIFDQLDKRHTSRKVSFWYGARSKVDLFYAEEFEDLATRHSNFTWTAALSEPAATDSWSGPCGFIHDIVLTSYLEQHPAPEECEYYLCGPPLMIRAVRLMLEELGVDAGNIFSDDFGT